MIVDYNSSGCESDSNADDANPRKNVSNAKNVSCSSSSSLKTTLLRAPESTVNENQVVASKLSSPSFPNLQSKKDIPEKNKNKKKKLSVQQLIKSTTALLDKIPATAKPQALSGMVPVPSARFSATEIELSMEKEFQQEDDEQLAQDKLDDFLSEITSEEPPAKRYEKALTVNSQREEMLSNLLVPTPIGPASLPPPTKAQQQQRPSKPKAETTWQRNARQEKLGQAKFTVKSNRDCPDIWDGGKSSAKSGGGDDDGPKSGQSAKERTHQKQIKGQSEWRTENAHGYWKTDEEMRLRQFYD